MTSSANPAGNETPPKRLGLVHTSATLVPVFQELCRAKLPNVDVFHISDDSVIKDVIVRQCVTPLTTRRLIDHVVSAEQAGADRILVTCSSIGRAVEMSESLVSVPVLRVDRPMADHAVATANRIGVIATLTTTLEPTSDLIQRRAQAIGKQVVVTAKVCEGAFDALMSGDAVAHDDAITQTLDEMANSVDCVVLAQASMARVVDAAGGRWSLPILTSPPLAIDHLATLFAEQS
ncbi:MAG: aspartate/glutamate racemase family protein [Pirellulaceae bacterium]|nr:aspartate/glutamate racemase family protein [Planctomycetales bacterium]